MVGGGDDREKKEEADTNADIQEQTVCGKLLFPGREEGRGRAAGGVVRLLPF